MITLFTTSKSLSNRIKYNNFIKCYNSWNNISGISEILLLGNELFKIPTNPKKRTFKIKDIKYNERGLPYLNDLFNLAKKYSSNDYLLFVNSDIILEGNFTNLLNFLNKNLNLNVYATGRRWKNNISFNLNSQINVSNLKIFESILDRPTAMDYFFFNKNLFSNVPNFVIARTCYDGWLLSTARKMNSLILDLSYEIKAFHQDHDYSEIEGGKSVVFNGIDSKSNIKLMGGYQNFHTVDSIYRIFMKNTLIYKNNSKYFLFWMKYYFLFLVKKYHHKIQNNYRYY